MTTTAKTKAVQALTKQIAEARAAGEAYDGARLRYLMAEMDKLTGTGW